jgi:hypothetical protein
MGTHIVSDKPQVQIFSSTKKRLPGEEIHERFFRLRPLLKGCSASQILATARYKYWPLCAAKNGRLTGLGTIPEPRFMHKTSRGMSRGYPRQLSPKQLTRGFICKVLSATLPRRKLPRARDTACFVCRCVLDGASGGHVEDALRVVVCTLHDDP